MLSSRSISHRVSIALALAGLAAAVAVPGTVAAMTTETYTLGGYEVYFGTDHAIFIGTGTGEGGLNELSGWYTSVYHSEVIDPTGVVTGGNAALQRVDGVQILGDIVGGSATQTDPGDNCTTQTYAITAEIANATRSDQIGATGTAELIATLTHYRGWIFGGCWVYSARVDGTITLKI